jgi:lipopolysaccharide export system permease protein
VSRFDRYILSQLLVTFGVFSLVLVLVYWINRAVRLFDQIISSGESFGVFLELSALTLPNVIKLVVPVSAFAASVYVTNRLSNESELVIVQSTGYSPWRLARPVLVFGVTVALFASVLAHVLVPASLARLSDRQTEIAENVTARLLVEGRFLHPSEGITFYISRITKDGELIDVFLSNVRAPERRISYTAERALLIRGETSPKLLMFDGMVQRLDTGTGRLSVTHYDQLTLDIGTLLDTPQPGQRRLAEWTTRDLLAATPERIAAAGTTKALTLFEAHSRITQSLLCITAPLLGFAALLIGGFSRFGLWRRIFGAVALLVVLQTLNTALTDVALSRLENWPLYYFSTLAAAIVVLVLFWLAAHPAAMTMHRRRAAP